MSEYRRRLMMAAFAGGAPGPAGMFPFSVAADKQVLFSPGNLQYQASTGLWRFAPNQYDVIGNAPGNTTLSDRDTQSDWIDLFGWGTSGWVGDSRQFHEPWRKGSAPQLYPAYPNLQGQYANGDWGVYNAIGDDPAGTWRTLMGDFDTGDEWGYLLNTRSASTVNGTANARYAFAVVADVKGLIIFPDVYVHPLRMAAPVNINTKNVAYSDNTYTAAEWEVIQSAGAVFLPACTGRGGDSEVGDLANGMYWTANAQCYFVVSGATRGTFTACAWITNDKGQAVRLVKDII